MLTLWSEPGGRVESTSLYVECCHVASILDPIGVFKCVRAALYVGEVQCIQYNHIFENLFQHFWTEYGIL